MASRHLNSILAEAHVELIRTEWTAASSARMAARISVDEGHASFAFAPQIIDAERDSRLGEHA
jgi:hypothetical protein